VSRVCAEDGCATVLSRYNPESLCGVHLEAERLRVESGEDDLEAKRRLHEARLRQLEKGRATQARNRTGLPKAGTTRRAIWERLPATRYQLAAELGLTSLQVSKALFNLMDRGLIFGEGGSDERDSLGRYAGTPRVYRRVEQAQVAA
jgi:hypothetical protein